jgi:hypothetical protein
MAQLKQAAAPVLVPTRKQSIDQHVTDAAVAHLGEGDFLRMGLHTSLCFRTTIPDLIAAFR